MKDYIDRLPFLSWIIIPLLGAWIAANYLVGALSRPIWFDQGKIDLMKVEAQTQKAKQATMPTYKWNNTGLVTFWFDDAWDSQYKVAFPILQEKQLKAAIAVPTKALGWEGYLTWGQLKRLYFNGWEMTAHSRNHQCDTTKFNTAIINDEVVGSLKDLEEQGLPAHIYVAPCGVFTPQVLELVKNNYISFRTSDQGLNPLPIKDYYSLEIFEIQTDTDINQLKSYLEEAKQTNSWLIIMFHKIDNSLESFSTRPEVLKQVVEMVTKSELPVVLPSQALNLTQ